MIEIEKYFNHIKKDKQEWIDAFKLNYLCYKVDTEPRICHFLAQCFHESADLTCLKENLHYSSERLLKIFPKYFKTPKDAKEYAKKPNAIANKVYANRMGNGDEQSGDGYKFRGRGIIQLTGKEDYNKFNVYLPDLLTQDKEYSFRIAFEFWISRGLNEIADRGDFVEIRQKINGGSNGLQDCIKRYRYLISL